MAPPHSSRWILFALVSAIFFSLVISGCLPAKHDSMPSVTVGVRGTSADSPEPVAPTPDQAQPAGQQPPPSDQIPSPVTPPAGQPTTQPEPVPGVQQALPSSSPPPPPAVIPSEQTSSASSGDPAKGIYPISPSDPPSYLGIGDITVKRTSRDKGEFKEIQLIVRNIGTYGFIPVVYMTFEKGVAGGSVESRLLEQKFELPYLKPGTKVVKWYPVSMYFHEIDKEKIIHLRVQEKYLSPPYDFERFDMAFIPREKFKSEEIKWT